MVVGRADLSAEIISTTPRTDIALRLVPVYAMSSAQLEAELGHWLGPGTRKGFPWWLLAAVFVVYEARG